MALWGGMLVMGIWCWMADTRGGGSLVRELGEGFMELGGIRVEWKKKRHLGKFIPINGRKWSYCHHGATFFGLKGADLSISPCQKEGKDHGMQYI